MTDNFNIANSERYNMSIRLSADGFSFCLSENGSDAEPVYRRYEVNRAYSMTANIKEMLASDELFDACFKSVSILIDTTRFTPVPFELFEDEDMEKLFYYNFDEKENEIVMCNITGRSDMAVLFGMDRHAHMLLEERFPEARFFASATPLAEYFSRRAADISSRVLHAHIHEEVLSLFSYSAGGRPSLINSFRCSEMDDRIYYIIHAWKVTGMDSEKDFLNISGETSGLEHITTSAQRFIRNVELIEQGGTLPLEFKALLLCE